MNDTPTIMYDLSFISLFLQADIVVKGVMILLALASLVCWTIIFEKVMRLTGIRHQASIFEKEVMVGQYPDLQGQGQRQNAISRIIDAGEKACDDQDISESRAERRGRIERAMRAVLAIDIRNLRSGLPFLATTGSSAPFIGLFGTVWGIMNSFAAIAQSQDTSLSVVAPGIAEALFATAIGLVAAIPAVIAYNKLTNDINNAQQIFLSGITALSDHLSKKRPLSNQPEIIE